MTKPNLIAIDLAKNSFHVVAESAAGKLTTNRTMTVSQLQRYLVRQPPSTVFMEACGSAHHWTWFAEDHGHQVMLLPAFHVTPYRQGHKTDQNDALAILAAGKRPNCKAAVKKSPEQLELQIFLQVRERYVSQKRSLANAIRGHLLEFGIRIPRGYKHLQQHLYALLEDADSPLPHRLRDLLHRLYQSYAEADGQLDELERELRLIVKECEPCQRLSQLEGIGPVNAVAIYTRIGNGQAFKNGREASALLGATPQQHSTGGVANIGHIRKRHVDKAMRANLIQGALAVINSRQKARTPRQSPKLKWLDTLVARRGTRIAAVALVNKNLRTAWAMLSNDTAYIAA